MFETIEKLCSLYGVSGREDEVRNYIIAQIKDCCDSCQTDPMGNLLVFKKGGKRPVNKVMLAAHMDEVGFYITHVTDAGLLGFAAIGIDPRVLVAKRVVVGDGHIPGVIGTKPIHLQKEAERSAVPEVDSLLIDIGAANKEETLKLVSPGDWACFDGGYREFGEGFIKARAVDDRAGCAVMMEMIRSELEYDTWFAFTVQEETGLRGARTAAYTIAPDAAIVLETTASSDMEGVEEEKKVCIVGGGAVVLYMDLRTIYDREYYRLGLETACRMGIAAQTKTAVSGGNDSGAIQSAAGGARTLAISVPTRYLHSPVPVCKKDDVTAVYRLAVAMSEKIAAGEGLREEQV